MRCTVSKSRAYTWLYVLLHDPWSAPMPDAYATTPCESTTRNAASGTAPEVIRYARFGAPVAYPIWSTRTCACSAGAAWAPLAGIIAATVTSTQAAAGRRCRMAKLRRGGRSGFAVMVRNSSYQPWLMSSWGTAWNSRSELTLGAAALPPGLTEALMLR